MCLAIGGDRVNSCSNAAHYYWTA